MAELIGLAASIIQIAGTGVKLSTTLYNYVGSASRADQEVTDIADDVEITANALESVGKVFEAEDAKSIVSKKAISDANNLIKRCETVFGDIQGIIEKRRKPCKEGKKLNTLGKFTWPLKEQKVELQRKRVESLKTSLVLLLHVLQLASSQAKGKLEHSALEEEREKIRQLHQHQQSSMKSLQALENKLSKVCLDDDETLQWSAPSSRTPTLDLMAHPPSIAVAGGEICANARPNIGEQELSELSETDVAGTDADGSEEELVTVDELSKCAEHAQTLLKRISTLQAAFKQAQPSKQHSRRRVNKAYQRFCHRFESDLFSHKKAVDNTQLSLPNFHAPSQAPEPLQKIIGQLDSNTDPFNEAERRRFRGVIATLRYRSKLKGKRHQARVRELEETIERLRGEAVEGVRTQPQRPITEEDMAQPMAWDKTSNRGDFSQTQGDAHQPPAQSQLAPSIGFDLRGGHASYTVRHERAASASVPQPFPVPLMPVARPPQTEIALKSLHEAQASRRDAQSREDKPRRRSPIPTAAPVASDHTQLDSIVPNQMLTFGSEKNKHDVLESFDFDSFLSMDNQNEGFDFHSNAIPQIGDPPVGPASPMTYTKPVETIPNKNNPTLFNEEKQQQKLKEYQMGLIMNLNCRVNKNRKMMYRIDEEVKPGGGSMDVAPVTLPHPAPSVGYGPSTLFGERHTSSTRQLNLPFPTFISGGSPQMERGIHSHSTFPESGYRMEESGMRDQNIHDRGPGSDMSEVARATKLERPTPEHPLGRYARLRRPLSQRAREEAYQMRKLSACTNCKQRKTKCDLEIPCSSCSKVSDRELSNFVEMNCRGVPLEGRIRTHIPTLTPVRHLPQDPSHKQFTEFSFVAETGQETVDDSEAPTSVDNDSECEAGENSVQSTDKEVLMKFLDKHHRGKNTTRRESGGRPEKNRYWRFRRASSECSDTSTIYARFGRVCIQAVRIIERAWSQRKWRRQQTTALLESAPSRAYATPGPSAVAGTRIPIVPPTAYNSYMKLPPPPAIHAERKTFSTGNPFLPPLRTADTPSLPSLPTLPEKSIPARREPVMVRSVVTRNVTYNRAPLESASGGKKRRVAGKMGAENLADTAAAQLHPLPKARSQSPGIEPMSFPHAKRRLPDSQLISDEHEISASEKHANARSPIKKRMRYEAPQMARHEGQLGRSADFSAGTLYTNEGRQSLHMERRYATATEESQRGQQSFSNPSIALRNADPSYGGGPPMNHSSIIPHGLMDCGNEAEYVNMEKRGETGMKRSSQDNDVRSEIDPAFGSGSSAQELRRRLKTNDERASFVSEKKNRKGRSVSRSSSASSHTVTVNDEDKADEADDEAIEGIEMEMASQDSGKDIVDILLAQWTNSVA